jgi:hypothetical protein
MRCGDVVRVDRFLRRPDVAILIAIDDRTAEVETTGGRRRVRRGAVSDVSSLPARPALVVVVIALLVLTFVAAIRWISDQSVLAAVVAIVDFLLAWCVALQASNPSPRRWLPLRSEHPRFPKCAIEYWAVCAHWDHLNGRYYFVGDVVLSTGQTVREVTFDRDTNVAVEIDDRPMTEFFGREIANVVRQPLPY